MNALAELDISDDGKKLLTSNILKIPELPSETNKFRLLNSDMVTRIENQYSDSNAKLAKDYLDINDEKLFQNPRQLPGYKDYNKAEFKFIYEFSRSLFKADKKSYQMLKDANNDQTSNESLNVMRRLMRNNFSLLASMQYYLARLIDRFH